MTYTYKERKARMTLSELRALRDQKHYLNGMFLSVTVTLDGRKWTIKSEEEADEILEAYSDWKV